MVVPLILLRFLLISVSVLLILTWFIPFANSDILTARQLPATKIDVQETPDLENKATTPTSEKIITGASSTRTSINAMPSAEYPLSVTKKIVDRNVDDSYFVGSPIRILVQITCLGGKTVNELNIWEHADKNLRIINYKKFFRSSIVNETINPEKYLCENYSHNSNDNLIYIQVHDMYSRESVIYEYSVIPLKPGIYNCYTVVGIPSNYPIYPEYVLPLDVKAIEEHPTFQVFLDIKELEWNIPDSIPLSFIMKYVGGASHNPCNYNVTLGNSDKYKLSKYEFPNISFSVHNDTPIYSTIRYSDEGTYNLPTVYIAGQYYKFDEKIKIKKSWRDLIEDTGLFLVTLLLFLATLGHVLVTGTNSWRIKGGIVIAIIFIFISVYVYLRICN